MISDKELRTDKTAKWGRSGLSFPLSSLAPGALLPWLLAGMGGALLGVYALGISILPQRLAMLAVLAFLLPIGLLIAGNVKRILLAVIFFEIPLQLDAYLGHQEAIADLNAISGINISITTLCLLILYGLWLAEALAGEAAPTPSLRRLSSPMIGYVAVVCLALIFANEVWLSVYELVILSQAFFLYIYLVHAVRSRKDLVFVMTILLGGLLLQALIMIGVRIVGHDITVASISATISKGGRVAGTIGSPNTASSYLTLLLAPALSLLLMHIDGWRKLLAISSFGLGSIALVLTLSRGAWIGVAFSVALLFFLAWQRGWISLTIPIALGICLLLLMLPLQDLILERIYGDDNGSAGARIPLIQIAFEMVKDHPIIGVGPNNFARSMGPYVTPDFSREWISTVHNKYMLVWSETGTIGLLMFMWLLLTIVWRGWQVWQVKDRFLSCLALGFTAAILGQMLHMGVELFNSRPQIQMLWLIAGLITTMHILSKTEAREIALS